MKDTNTRGSNTINGKKPRSHADPADKKIKQRKNEHSPINENTVFVRNLKQPLLGCLSNFFPDVKTDMGDNIGKDDSDRNDANKSGETLLIVAGDSTPASSSITDDEDKTTTWSQLIEKVAKKDRPVEETFDHYLEEQHRRDLPIYYNKLRPIKIAREIQASFEKMWSDSVWNKYAKLAPIPNLLTGSAANITWVKFKQQSTMSSPSAVFTTPEAQDPAADAMTICAVGARIGVDYYYSPDGITHYSRIINHLATTLVSTGAVALCKAETPKDVMETAAKSGNLSLLVVPTDGKSRYLLYSLIHVDVNKDAALNVYEIVVEYSIGIATN